MIAILIVLFIGVYQSDGGIKSFILFFAIGGLSYWLGTLIYEIWGD